MLLVTIPVVNNNGISIVINEMVRTLKLRDPKVPTLHPGSAKAAAGRTAPGFLHLLLRLSGLAGLFWAVLRAPAQNHVH